MNLSKSLDLYNTRTGSYPTPDNAFQVTYSGGVLWNQGNMSNTAMTALSAGGIRMSKKPTDPLTPTKEYKYSTLAFGSAYQLQADYEGDNVSLRPAVPGIDIALAAPGDPTITYVKGNYNGVVVKTSTGSPNTIYLLAVPSLFLATGSGIVVLSTTTATGFYLHGQTNIG